MQINNIFQQAEPPPTGESFETILAHKNLVIERILSSQSIDKKEYIQTQDEWVLLLQGEAVLAVDKQTITLKSGDYLFLPSGTPHRVLTVTEGAIWLAIHLH